MRLFYVLAVKHRAGLSQVHAAPVAPQVSEAPLRAHLDFLADDLLEGRGTGQRGGDLTVRYLETQAAAIGLKLSQRQQLPPEGRAGGQHHARHHHHQVRGGRQDARAQAGQRDLCRQRQRQCRNASRRPCCSWATASIRRTRAGTITRAPTCMARCWW
ncbi:hypothetical protein LP419_37205 [Massilia sp. H-1]|nr:hypothetical protein LP419_37205 [Massilia sp. H-1]